MCKLKRCDMKCIGILPSLSVTMFQCWLDIVMTTSSSTTLSSSFLCESFSFMLLVLSFISGCAGNDHTSTPQWRCKSYRLCQYTHIHASKLYRFPLLSQFPQWRHFSPWKWWTGFGWALWIWAHAGILEWLWRSGLLTISTLASDTNLHSSV